MLTQEVTTINGIEVIKILGAKTKGEGIAYEHSYVSSKFGILGKDYKCEFWLSFNKKNDGNPGVLDIANVTLSNGSEKQIYFDVSDFYLN